MANFLTHYKKINRNLYSLIISLLIALWYNGISGIINYYWPNRGPMISIIFMIIPLILFLTDDGHLDELYTVSNIEYPVYGHNNQIAAINASINAVKRQEKFT